MAPKRKDGSPAKRKSARELVEGTPGIFKFRRDVILALCHGTSVNTNNWSVEEIGRRIAAVADAIIESSEQ